MDRGDAQNPDQKMIPAGASEPADEELIEIDPAEFFDPEEFGVRRSGFHRHE